MQVKWTFVAKTGHRITVIRKTYASAHAAAIRDLEYRVTINATPKDGNWDLDLVATEPSHIKNEVVR